ncbi:MAG: chemotaxis protein CheW [Gammaproteobacteria bacterium]
MSSEPAELYSLLIPLEGERLLVPRVCVAEVIMFSDPERPSEDDQLPSWFLGRVEWGGRRVPVVSFEGISGEEPQNRGGRTRIVVFHAIGEDLKGGYFGMITQGFPQLVRVNRDVLSLESEEQSWPEGQPVLCRTRMINEYPLIPDMERLEAMLAEIPG